MSVETKGVVHEIDGGAVKIVRLADVSGLPVELAPLTLIVQPRGEGQGPLVTVYHDEIHQQLEVDAVQPWERDQYGRRGFIRGMLYAAGLHR